VDKLAFPSATKNRRILLEQNLRLARRDPLREHDAQLPALFSCQRAFAPRPAEPPTRSGPKNKKPGVERRADPPSRSADLRDARLFSIRYS